MATLIPSDPRAAPQPGERVHRRVHRRAQRAALLSALLVATAACIGCSWIDSPGQSAMLEPEDFGQGWSTYGGSPPANHSRVCGAGDSVARAELIAGGDLSHDWMNFEAPPDRQPDPDTEIYVRQGVLIFDSPEQVQEMLEASRIAFTACPTDSEPGRYTRGDAKVDGMKNNTIVDPPPGAHFAFRQVDSIADTGEISDAGYTVYQAMGNVLLTFTYTEHLDTFGVGFPAPQSEPPAWWYEAFDAAIEKVESVLDP